MINCGTRRNIMEIALPELLYFSFLLIMFSIKGFGLYDGQLLYKLFFVLSFGCIGIKLLLEEHSKIDWIIIAILAGLVLIMNRSSGEKGPLIIYATIIGMKNIDVRKIMKLGAVSLGLSSLFFVLFNLSSLYNTPCFLHRKLGMTQAIRWTLGYPHPNSTAMTYLAIMMLLIYCLGEKYNWKYFFLFLLGNLWINLYCLSYTGFIVCTLYLLLAFIVRAEELPVYLCYLVKWVYPICIVFSIVIPYIISNTFVEFLSKYFHSTFSRIMLSKQYANRNTLTIWGMNVTQLTDSNYSLDNSYLYSLIFNGLLFTVLISILYIFTINMLVKRRNYAAIAIIVALCMEGIMEPLLFNTSFKNIGIFFLGAFFWDLMKKANENAEEKCLIKNEEIKIAFQFNPDIICKVISGIILIMFLLIFINNYPVVKVNFAADVYNKLIEANELEKAIILEKIRAVTTIVMMGVSSFIMIKKISCIK